MVSKPDDWALVSQVLSKTFVMGHEHSTLPEEAPGFEPLPGWGSPRQGQGCGERVPSLSHPLQCSRPLPDVMGGLCQLLGFCPKEVLSPKSCRFGVPLTGESRIFLPGHLELDPQTSVIFGCSHGKMKPCLVMISSLNLADSLQMC